MSLPALLNAAVESSVEVGISLSDALAGLAVLISLTGAWITWRIHKESGGRVTVRMFPAYYRPFAGIGSLHVGSTNSLSVGHPQAPVIEMAEVTIQNAGRTGVTVTGVALQVRQGKVALGRVGPRTFTLKGVPGHETDGQTYFRIDPYDQRILLIDYWAVVDAVFKKNPGLRDLSLLVEVTVAGQDRPSTSKKMGYWRIFREQISALDPGTKRRPRDAFLLAMLRSNSRDLSLMDSLDYIALQVEYKIPYPVTMDETVAVIDDLLTSVEGEMIREEWAEKFDRGGFIQAHPVARYLVNQSALYGKNFDLDRPESAALLG